MKTIIFICQGNICRSPTGMFILRDKLKKLGLENEYNVISAGLESSTAGLDIEPRAKKELDDAGIPYTVHKAHQLKIQEVVNADYILCMQVSHKIAIKRMMSSSKNTSKVHLLLSYTGESRDIEDPYFYGDFHKAFQEIERGVDAFVEKEILNK